MHIAIAGNIGAGKTTLTKLLAKHYKFNKQLEDVVKNPYLDDFYNQMERWSFNLQIYFLNSRFRQVKEIHEKSKNVIQDRTIYEDANIFAPNLHAMGLMTNRDFENYRSLFGPTANEELFIHKLKNGIKPEGIENWLPLFYSNPLCNVVDFFNIEAIFADENFLTKSKEKIKYIFDLYDEKKIRRN